MIYLDNLLIMADSREKASDQCIATICLLESLSFLVNYRKSQVQHVQVLTFLGLVVDSTQRTLSLPSQKLVKIKFQAQDALKQETAPARMLAWFIGKLSATCLVVQPAPLQYRGLQDPKHQALKWSRSYD